MVFRWVELLILITSSISYTCGCSIIRINCDSSKLAGVYNGG